MKLNDEYDQCLARAKQLLTTQDAASSFLRYLKQVPKQGPTYMTPNDKVSPLVASETCCGILYLSSRWFNLTYPYPGHYDTTTYGDALTLTKLLVALAIESSRAGQQGLIQWESNTAYNSLVAQALEAFGFTKVVTFPNPHHGFANVTIQMGYTPRTMDAIKNATIKVP